MVVKFVLKNLGNFGEEGPFYMGPQNVAVGEISLSAGSPAWAQPRPAGGTATPQSRPAWRPAWAGQGASQPTALPCNFLSKNV